MKSKLPSWADGFATKPADVRRIEQPVRDDTLAAFLGGKALPKAEKLNGHEIVAANEGEAEVLREATPADIIETVLAKRTQATEPRERRAKPDRMSDIERGVGKVLPPKPKPQIVRGSVLVHAPTGRQVTVVKTDVGVTSKGEIKHRVMTRGLARKFEVPESSLEELP